MIQAIWFPLETGGTHSSFPHCKGKGRGNTLGGCDKMPKINSWKRGQVYFGLWLHKFQSVVAQLTSLQCHPLGILPLTHEHGAGGHLRFKTLQTPRVKLLDMKRSPFLFNDHLLECDKSPGGTLCHGKVKVAWWVCRVSLEFHFFVLFFPEENKRLLVWRGSTCL